MQSQLKKVIPIFSRVLLAVLSVAVIELLLQPFQSILGIQIIALLFLLPVMLSTVLWGLAPGIIAGFVSFFVFNYFYIQPFHTLFVHQTQDLITLVIFLCVAVVLSQLIGQARKGMRLARSREWEATRMYELISALSGLQDTASIVRELANHTRETFGFDRIEIVPADQGAENGRPADGGGAWLDLPVPTLTLPLETARGPEGVMRIWAGGAELSPQEGLLLGAYASQGALSLERVRLARSENKARVLEESDRLKSSLLNSVSHELRTPLAVIKASVSSLRSGAVAWDTEARQELVSTIEEETDQLNRLVGNLLDMSRIESGALNLQFRWNSIEEIARGVAAKMRKQLENHLLQLKFAEDLPLVPTDFVMVDQVFLNLLSNSVKYAPSGSTISLEAGQEGDSLHITVANQGPPVPPGHLERIFDKFYRVTEADRVTGVGLGLSICKGIVEAHGGKIWAENQPGWFVFHFTLPATLNGELPQAPREANDE